MGICLSCLNLTCFKCDPTLSSNEIGLDVIIDDNCCRIGKVQTLRDKMDRLRALKMDVDSEINDNRSTQVEVSNEVQTWREKVGELDDEVSRIIASDAANGMACCFLCSKNKFGILSRINRIHDLISQKNTWKDSSIFIPRHGSYILECFPTNVVVGMEQVMSQVLQYLNDDNVGVIGIHGMGGVGKTTLAKQLIMILSLSLSPSTSAAARGQESVKFDNRIWVTVSRNPDIGKLQEDIAKELNLHESSGFIDKKDESIRARFLSSYLSARRFLLVLDDVWKQFDLRSIGIPEPQRNLGSKIVLTTREAKVCTNMGARKSMVKVGCLEEEESWELFKKTIQWNDDEFQEKDIYQIARDIAHKCGGLPLALITVARAMATKSEIGLWRRAYELLKDSPHNVDGMDDVYRLLEFSYDSLKKEDYKSCLLYSCLFPEDEDILISRMVDYCIGGGSVSVDRNMSPNIVSLRYEGRFIISELIDACLLEGGKDEDHVRVYDAIRDMILNWIGKQNSESRIVSYAGKGLSGTHYVNVEEWKAAAMLSFSHNRHLEELVIEEEAEEQDHGKSTAQCSGKVDKIPFQSNILQVLLLNETHLFGGSHVDKLQVEWLFCPTLRVLDLSSTGLQEIPLSLCSLKLLQYLNLSWTKIKALPKEMGKLRNLLQLDLSSTWYLKEIPNGLFSSLSKLQSLHLWHCVFFSSNVTKSLPVLKEIGHMRLLQDLSLSLGGDVDVVKFIVDRSDSLSNSITCLSIKEGNIFRDDLFKRMGSRLKRLQSLFIRNGNCTEDLVIDDGHFSELNKLQITNAGSFGHIILKGQALKDLTCLEIIRCPKLRTLACLWKLPNLKDLDIRHCPQIVELIDPSQSEGDEISNDLAILSKLESLRLEECPNLLRLSSSPVQLHSLKSLYFSRITCLNDISTIKSPHEVEIRCEKKWWEDLQWENYEGVPPPNFIPIFQPW